MNTKSMKIIALVVGASLVGISACSTNTKSQNTALGVVGGALVGGGVGALVAGSGSTGAAVATGAVVGGVLGGVIGYNMDSSDKVQMNQAMNNTPTHHHKHWKNKKTQTSYNFTPTSNKMAYNGHSDCRNYTLTSYSNATGKKQVVNGTACRQADGSWMPVKS